MRDDPYVITLVARATDGDQTAWDEIVERYAPLVWRIGIRYRLSAEDIADVGQKVWLLLVEKIGSLREPAALPGWLAKTTQHECLHVLGEARRHDHAELPPEDQMPTDSDTSMIEEEILLAERNAALRAALAELPHPCRELLSMMICDPPCKYEDISATLGMKIGSIGPLRARCLERIRRSPHLASIIGTVPGKPSAARGERGD
jgi:RNA polymerase sigma factor (sigma-70 family)